MITEKTAKEIVKENEEYASQVERKLNHAKILLEKHDSYENRMRVKIIQRNLDRLKKQIGFQKETWDVK